MYCIDKVNNKQYVGREIIMESITNDLMYYRGIHLFGVIEGWGTVEIDYPEIG